MTKEPIVVKIDVFAQPVTVVMKDGTLKVIDESEVVKPAQRPKPRDVVREAWLNDRQRELIRKVAEGLKVDDYR